MSEIRNTQQWCPSVEDVVVITVEGSVKGNLITGKVVNCNPGRSKHKCRQPSSRRFCWIGRQITTALW